MAIVINGSGTITGVSAGGLPDDSVDAGMMAANSIDSDSYVDGSIDNAHLADDAVGVAELSATGTASSSTFLRGDNAWAEPAGGGITEADIWTMGTDFFGDVDPIINWARSAYTNDGLLGTGMSYSAGVFTFPSTGFWRVQFKHGAYVDGDDRSFQTAIKSTADNSSYSRVSNAQTGLIDSGNSNTHAQCVAEVILDITDTSNQKVRFETWSQNQGTRHYGYIQSTTATFIRLGDT